MSGICCIYPINNELKHSNESINNMLKSLKHKGPDKQKFLSIENILFFQSMFNVTKEDQYENLPQAHNEIVICADARIDNRDDLIDMIGLKYRKNYLDSELIVESYKKWGKSFAKKIIGAFAIIIYDKKSKELLCIRDQVGLKPLYYYKDSNLLIISSSIRAIKEQFTNTFSVDIARIREYLFFSAGSKERTFFSSIKSIPKASMFIVKKKKIEEECYYKLKPNKKYSNYSENDYIKEFENIFIKVIKSHLRSPNDISASALSGGLDSSSVSLLANRIKGNKNHLSISCVFKGLKGIQRKIANENEYINACHEMINHHKIIDLKNIGPVTKINEFQNLYESPVPAINGYMHDAMFKEASNFSSRIFLDGFDGDSVVSHGQEKIYDYPKKLKIFKLFKEKKIIDRSYGRKFSILSTVKNYIIKPLVPNKLDFLYKSFRRKHNVPYNIFNLVKLNSKRKSYKYAYLINYFGFYPFKFSGSAAKSHIYTLENPIWEFSFRMIEGLSENHNIEVRYPFFDLRLMELCVSIPPELKFQKGLNRYIFRMAMKKYIPNKIIERKDKADISPFAVNEVKNIDIDLLVNDINENKITKNLINTNYLKKYFVPEINKNNGIAVLRIYQIYSLLKWIKGIKWPK